MTAWKWAVVGLVAAALLLGLGFLWGHVSSTTSEADRLAWEARTDSLLGVARQAHRDTVEAQMARADSAEAAAKRLAERARQAEANRAESDAAAARLAHQSDSLEAVLAGATSTEEMVIGLTGLLASVRGELAHAKAEIVTARGEADDAKGAYEKQLLASAELRGRIANDSLRILDLEQDLEDRPKSDRWRLRFLGMDFRPCVFTGVGIDDRRGTVGAGACATP